VRRLPGLALTGAFAAGLWNEVARSAISAHGLGEAESARILAMMHMVGVDAFIACHDAKYTYWVPRPTQVDPDIRLTQQLWLRLKLEQAGGGQQHFGDSAGSAATLGESAGSSRRSTSTGLG
jgi:hypothetical protein